MDAFAAEPIVARVEQWLGDSAGPNWDAILEGVIERLGCVLGTIHVLDRRAGLLRLCAQRGVPPPVLDKVQAIPIGKGMAGLAAERREPVQVCNLQQDSSVVKPGAKLTRAEGSIAVPMLHENELAGVLGVAKREPYEFLPQESALLMALGRRIAARLTDMEPPRSGDERDR